MYVDDFCVSVSRYTTLENLLQCYPNGWFFGIYEKQDSSMTCENVQPSCSSLDQDKQQESTCASNNY